MTCVDKNAGKSSVASRGNMMQRQVASPDISDYDRADPTFHEYQISSRLCSSGPGCTVKSMAPLADPDSAPRWGSVVQGYNVLHMNNPIYHSSFFGKDGSFYMINVTDATHSFHAGAVVSRLIERSGGVFLETHGFGYSTGPFAKSFNYAVGYAYFSGWQAQVTSSAKIQTGQIDPRALK